MQALLFTAALLIFSAGLAAQTPGNTQPGSTTPANTNPLPRSPAPTATFYTHPPQSIAPATPVGTHGTDMTNPNLNGSFETNPDQRPRDNFQSAPSTHTLTAPASSTPRRQH